MQAQTLNCKGHMNKSEEEGNKKSKFTANPSVADWWKFLQMNCNKDISNVASITPNRFCVTTWCLQRVLDNPLEMQSDTLTLVQTAKPSYQCISHWPPKAPNSNPKHQL